MNSPEALQPGVVHLWQFGLDTDGETLGRLAPLLSSDERMRADQYKLGKTRERFIVGRGTLRLILAKYLGVDAASIEFAYGPHGKPEVANANGLHFNLSHSGALALLAVASTVRVGVDLEEVREVGSVDGIVKNHFSPSEIGAFFDLPIGQRQEAFLRAFTRKEAILKALGHGLEVPLQEVEVSLLPDDLRHRTSFGSPLRLHEVSLERGFVGALAADCESSVHTQVWVHGLSY